MKKLMILLIMVIGLSNYATAQKTINVPYFGKMTAQELCGSSTEFCQPTSSSRFAKVKAKVYKGEIEYELFRKFKKSIFETTPCSNSELSANDYTISSSNTLTASVESKEKKSFDQKLEANLTKIIGRFFGKLDESIKADIKAELIKNIESETNQEIELEYIVYDLTQRFIDDNLSTCMDSDPKKRKIVTGISILTVSGEWTTDVFKKTFTNFEGNVQAFNALSVESKNEYEKEKKVILDGNFEAISIIFSVAYRK